MINFYLARSASETLILSPDHDGDIAEVMFRDVLGIYPQPPFSLHALHNLDEEEEMYKSIRLLMSAVDGVEYPAWLLKDL